MSWKQTDPMHERHEFIAAYLSGVYSISELAERYGISRKTAYKWIKRFESEGLAGLDERSRAPKQCRHRIAEAVAERLLTLRRKHPYWGPVTIRAVLQRRAPELLLPAASTIGALFERHGLSSKRPPRRRLAHREHGVLEARAANALWCCDFKGEFLLGNRQYCYPLTITDAFSRMLLVCQAQASTSYELTRRHFQRAFSEYGLPEAIRSDNGAPFASQAPRRLSRLSLWWVKLGIGSVLNRPGCPQDNPQHERMHGTLKQQTTRPPGANPAAQQRKFNRFRHEYNHERPHQGIGLQTPATLYQPSRRLLPARLPEPEYPEYWQQRRVDAAGALNFQGHAIFLSEVLIGETVGLEEIDDGIWNVWIYHVLLGRVSHRNWKLQ